MISPTGGNELWRGGRVVECTGLENQRAARYRGFESLPLRTGLKIGDGLLIDGSYRMRHPLVWQDAHLVSLNGRYSI